MFDKFLKFHAVQLRIDPSVSLSQELVTEITSLVKQAKPQWTYVYVEPVTSFLDTMTIEDVIEIVFGPYLLEPIYAVNNQPFIGLNPLLVGDAFIYESASPTVGNTPGTYTITPTPPYSDGTTRQYFVFGRFDLSVTVSGSGGRRPTEGVDYTFNYSTGSLVLTSTLSATPVFHYVVCFVRLRASGDTLISGETRVVVGGPDPTVLIEPGQPIGASGLIDRALQVTLS
jgi:hypothetical protein